MSLLNLRRAADALSDVRVYPDLAPKPVARNEARQAALALDALHPPRDLVDERDLPRIAQEIAQLRQPRVRPEGGWVLGPTPGLLPHRPPTHPRPGSVKGLAGRFRAP